ncbi:MAG: type II toxin-antitoxin system HicB family antitoxin [Anaerolineales bacterium]|nr:type II toxin-antitoxin system HicB family antitoxin [Anaerolineales bacterium]
MSRLTLRLPETLHRQLKTLARNEAVSLNQYIVFALTRQATLAYTVQPVSEEEARRQQTAFAALLQSLGQASFDEIQRTLNRRRRVKPEKGLTPDTLKALKNRIARQRPRV